MSTRVDNPESAGLYPGTGAEDCQLITNCTDCKDDPVKTDPYDIKKCLQTAGIFLYRLPMPDWHGILSV
jgi:hypothetical protein